MSFQMLVQFTVQEDKVDAFVDIMQGAKARILAAEGCEGVDVFVSTEKPNKVVLSERWQTKELHDDYADKMRESGSMNAIGAFLAEMPVGEFFAIK